mmetsp:Transcript_130006/g.259343  ORF Transcript_130006/g.259343 Transcript_130006/m.259343 type:complete len:249 (+) Transcript_130006:1019-1765(+)
MAVFKPGGAQAQHAIPSIVEAHGKSINPCLLEKARWAVWQHPRHCLWPCIVAIAEVTCTTYTLDSTTQNLFNDFLDPFRADTRSRLFALVSVCRWCHFGKGDSKAQDAFKRPVECQCMVSHQHDALFHVLFHLSDLNNVHGLHTRNRTAAKRQIHGQWALRPHGQFECGGSICANETPVVLVACTRHHALAGRYNEGIAASVRHNIKFLSRSADFHLYTKVRTMVDELCTCLCSDAMFVMRAPGIKYH